MWRLHAKYSPLTAQGSIGVAARGVSGRVSGRVPEVMHLWLRCWCVRMVQVGPENAIIVLQGYRHTVKQERAVAADSDEQMQRRRRARKQEDTGG